MLAIELAMGRTGDMGARYKLEAFIRDYFDMAEWKELCEAIKKQLGAKHV
jgi:hypothetical protein